MIVSSGWSIEQILRGLGASNALVLSHVPAIGESGFHPVACCWGGKPESFAWILNPHIHFPGKLVAPVQTAAAASHTGRVAPLLLKQHWSQRFTVLKLHDQSNSCIHTHHHSSTSLCAWLCLSISVRKCISIFVSVYVYMYMYACMYIYIYMYMYVCICIYIYIYIYICVCVSVGTSWSWDFCMFLSPYVPSWMPRKKKEHKMDTRITGGKNNSHGDKFQRLYDRHNTTSLLVYENSACKVRIPYNFTEGRRKENEHLPSSSS